MTPRAHQIQYTPFLYWYLSGGTKPVRLDRWSLSVSRTSRSRLAFRDPTGPSRCDLVAGTTRSEARRPTPSETRAVDGRAEDRGWGRRLAVRTVPPARPRGPVAGGGPSVVESRQSSRRSAGRPSANQTGSGWTCLTTTWSLRTR